MLRSFGTGELLLIFGIALLLFGSRLPKIAKSIGSTARSFKKGLADEPVTPSKTVEPEKSKAPRLAAQAESLVALHAHTNEKSKSTDAVKE